MKRVGALVVVVIAVLSGCQYGTWGTPTPPIRENLVQPIVQLDIDEQNKIVVELGFFNRGKPQAPEDDFKGVWELTTGDGELRARGETYELPPLPGRGQVLPLRWQAQLDPGNYRLVWGAPGYGATVIEFWVLERDGKLFVHDQHVWQDTAYPPPTRIVH